jgi:hypothetical protein
MKGRDLSLEDNDQIFLKTKDILSENLFYERKVSNPLWTFCTMTVQSFSTLNI